jgi:hypothetical protein
MPLLLQPMSPHAVFTLMESHLLCTLTHQQITKIIYTVPVVQLVLAKRVR